MAKYIDAKSLYNQVFEKEELARQRVIDTPSRLPNGDVNPSAIRYATQLDERTTFKFMLTYAPAADVVEVVRCKDCKHYKTMFCKMDIWHKDITLYRADENDFCSYGEKKDGQSNYQDAPLSFGFCESDDMWQSLYGETYEVAHIDTDDDFYCGYAKRRTDE